MSGEKNLIRLSSEEAREYGSRGGKKSAEVRRKKKALRECMKCLLDMPVTSEKHYNVLAQFGIDENDIDNRMLLATSLFVNAVEKGNVAAYQEIRDLDVSQEEKKETGPYILPATVLAAPFLSVYRDIKDKQHNEYLLYGGRGSTKSSFVALMIVDIIKNHPELHAVICRKVKDTLRDSVYAQIVWAIDELGLTEEFTCHVSPMEIVYKETGQKIYFRGADKPEKLKSIKPPFGSIGVLWFEELDQFSGDNEIRNIEQSVVRGGDVSFVFKTFNPPQTIANWANEYAAISKGGRYDHHSSYLDVPPEWLGKKFIEDAEFLKEVNPRAYEHEYLGVANGTGGNVFENVKIREITDEEIEGFDRIYRGIDWGWYPDPFRYHAMYYSASERKLYIFDEISGNKLSNQIIGDKLLEHGVEGDDKITADSGGEGKKSVADFRSRGFYMRGAIKGPGSVEYSMKWLSSLNEIVIDRERCPNAATEFEHYEYERDKDGNVISGYPDKDNHSIDAVRYALEEIWKRRGQ